MRALAAPVGRLPVVVELVLLLDVEVVEPRDDAEVGCEGGGGEDGVGGVVRRAVETGVVESEAGEPGGEGEGEQEEEVLDCV